MPDHVLAVGCRRSSLIQTSPSSASNSRTFLITSLNFMEELIESEAKLEPKFTTSRLDYRRWLFLQLKRPNLVSPFLLDLAFLWLGFFEAPITMEGRKSRIESLCIENIIVGYWFSSEEFLVT